MNIDDRNKQGKTFSNFKGSLHIGMGGLYLVMGAAVIYLKAFGAMVLSAGIAYTIGVMMILYGGFRVWRGWVDLKNRPAK